MAATLTLSVVEIIVLLFGAIILGITIHFFIASRKILKTTADEYGKNSLAKDEWKLKYFNDMEVREKEISELRKETGELKNRLQDSEENASIYSMEAEEMHRSNKTLKAELEKLRQSHSNQPADTGIIEELRQQVRQLQQELSRSTQVLPADHANKPKDYLDQLREAQHSLIEQNEKINRLLGNIDVIKEKEEMQQMMLRTNEELSAQVEEMQLQLSEKENEIHTIKQKENLTKEMSSMLDHAYSDFNILKDKIQKLETQLTSSKMANMEFEDLKEAHSKINSDLEEYKHRYSALATENQDLKMQVDTIEDQLRESNFQRVQLQKKVAYLEELNNDLQVVSDANKKLEGQLKRIGELESMLNMVSEERDQLISRSPDNRI